MSVTSVVEKATSDMLIGPDWALNLDLCDAINNDPTQAKEVVKAVKKRLTNRNAQVQLLALTVLETLIKNCGDPVHQQVAEKDVLHELVKLVKKKADMRVRDKTLVLVDSWQEAFGGSSGRYPQYYIAYSELQKAGVEFPRRGGEPSPPIFTPPQSQPLASPRQYGPRTPSPRSPGPPSSGSVDTENLSGMSLAEIKQAQNLVELLQDMVKALNPRDRMSAKEEVIVELVDQCRINQHRVMQLVNVTSDEQLLGQGLSLNDELQRVLTRYDAFLSGAPIPDTSPERTTLSPKIQTQTEAQTSPQGAAGTSARPKGSARTIFPGLPIPPPPTTGKRPATQSSNAASAVPAAASADASFDLLSGDPTYQLLSGDTAPPSRQPEVSSSSSMALTVIDQPQPKQEQKVEDLLALPAPEGFSNPFDSSPFQATPSTEVTSPAYSPQSFAETPVLRSENSWAAAPVVGSPRQQNSFYGTQHTESVSGQPVQSQSQYYYPQPQPVPTTPPPWQEDTQVPQATQQWQAPSQGYGYGGNTAWNSGQQPGTGVMQQQQYPGTGYAGYSTQPSTQPSWPSNDSFRLGQVGTGPGENFGSQYLNQRGISYGQSSPYGASQQQYPNVSKPSVKSPDTLFNDLVDLRSVNAKFKAASLANKAPNTSKAGP